MLLAVRRHLALEVEARCFHAGVMRAAPAMQVHHPVLGMLTAVRRRFALDVEARFLHTGFM